jgi:hypothetical protein
MAIYGVTVCKAKCNYRLRSGIIVISYYPFVHSSLVYLMTLRFSRALALLLVVYSEGLLWARKAFFSKVGLGVVNLQKGFLTSGFRVSNGA